MKERLVERLERAVFFRITRFVAWGMLVASGLALLVSLAGVGMAALASLGSARVTLDEVRQALAGAPPAPTPTPAQRTARRETRGERRVRGELERTLALFTLILVVLNIERNTRHGNAPGGGATGLGTAGMPVAAAQVSSPEPHEGAWGAGPR